MESAHIDRVASVVLDLSDRRRLERPAARYAARQAASWSRRSDWPDILRTAGSGRKVVSVSFSPALVEVRAPAHALSSGVIDVNRIRISPEASVTGSTTFA